MARFPASAGEPTKDAVLKKKEKESALARVAAGLGGLLSSEANVKGGYEKVDGVKVKRETDLTKLALRNVQRRNLFLDTQASAKRLKGGVFDFTSAKDNYGVGRNRQVFYYGAPTQHYAARGASLKSSVFSGRRFYGNK